MAKDSCPHRIEEFQRERERMNKLIMEYGGKDIKRFFSIDSSVYRNGALSKKTKELLGLVSSLVLRCEDCVNYHLIHCKKEGYSTEELMEGLTVGLIIGGSITIPHIRRALDAWVELQEKD